ncbi:F-box protein dre-1 [Diplonema papillatum]|nr:F-box protein dre-1 [Diplonema papillatum]KAJ9467155.1 F-box protein dre-1 [Diplonema papillatum]
MYTFFGGGVPQATLRREASAPVMRRFDVDEDSLQLTASTCSRAEMLDGEENLSISSISTMLSIPGSPAAAPGAHYPAFTSPTATPDPVVDPPAGEGEEPVPLVPRALRQLKRKNRKEQARKAILALSGCVCRLAVERALRRGRSHQLWAPPASGAPAVAAWGGTAHTGGSPAVAGWCWASRRSPVAEATFADEAAAPGLQPGEAAEKESARTAAEQACGGSSRPAQPGVGSPGRDSSKHAGAEESGEEESRGGSSQPGGDADRAAKKHGKKTHHNPQRTGDAADAERKSDKATRGSSQRSGQLEGDAGRASKKHAKTTRHPQRAGDADDTEGKPSKASRDCGQLVQLDGNAERASSKKHAKATHRPQRAAGTDGTEGKSDGANREGSSPVQLDGNGMDRAPNKKHAKTGHRPERACDPDDTDRQSARANRDGSQPVQLADNAGRAPVKHVKPSPPKLACDVDGMTHREMESAADPSAKGSCRAADDAPQQQQQQQQECSKSSRPSSLTCGIDAVGEYPPPDDRAKSAQSAEAQTRKPARPSTVPSVCVSPRPCNRAAAAEAFSQERQQQSQQLSQRLRIDASNDCECDGFPPAGCGCRDDASPASAENSPSGRALLAGHAGRSLRTVCLPAPQADLPPGAFHGRRDPAALDGGHDTASSPRGLAGTRRHSTALRGVGTDGKLADDPPGGGNPRRRRHSATLRGGGAEDPAGLEPAAGGGKKPGNSAKVRRHSASARRAEASGSGAQHADRRSAPDAPSCKDSARPSAGTRRCSADGPFSIGCRDLPSSFGVDRPSLSLECGGGLSASPASSQERMSPRGLSASLRGVESTGGGPSSLREPVTPKGSADGPAAGGFACVASSFRFKRDAADAGSCCNAFAALREPASSIVVLRPAERTHRAAAAAPVCSDPHPSGQTPGKAPPLNLPLPLPEQVEACARAALRELAAFFKACGGLPPAAAAALAAEAVAACGGDPHLLKTDLTLRYPFQRAEIHAAVDPWCDAAGRAEAERVTQRKAAIARELSTAAAAAAAAHPEPPQPAAAAAAEKPVKAERQKKDAAPPPAEDPRLPETDLALSRHPFQRAEIRTTAVDSWCDAAGRAEAELVACELSTAAAAPTPPPEAYPEPPQPDLGNRKQAAAAAKKPAKAGRQKKDAAPLAKHRKARKGEPARVADPPAAAEGEAGRGEEEARKAVEWAEDDAFRREPEGVCESSASGGISECATVNSAVTTAVSTDDVSSQATTTHETSEQACRLSPSWNDDDAPTYPTPSAPSPAVIRAQRIESDPQSTPLPNQTAASTVSPVAPGCPGSLSSGEGGVPSYQSIQQAIDAASPGSVISILPGVYYEDIRVWKPVRLEGEGPAGSVVLCPAAYGQCPACEAPSALPRRRRTPFRQFLCGSASSLSAVCTPHAKEPPAAAGAAACLACAYARWSAAAGSAATAGHSVFDVRPSTAVQSARSACGAAAAFATQWPVPPVVTLAAGAGACSIANVTITHKFHAPPRSGGGEARTPSHLFLPSESGSSSAVLGGKMGTAIGLQTQQGVLEVAARLASVENCVIVGSVGAALCLTGGNSALVEACRVSNTHARGVGVSIVGEALSLLVGNVVTDCGCGLVVVEGKGTAPLLKGNRFVASRGGGLVFGAGCQGVAEDNEISDNGCVGVIVEAGAAPVLSGNRIENNQGGGIRVGDRATAPVVKNNAFRSNGERHAFLSGTSAAHLLHNSFELGVFGVVYADKAAGLLDGNSFSSISTRCVVSRNAACPTISRNTFEFHPPAGGVLVLDASRPTLLKNHFVGLAPQAITAAELPVSEANTFDSTKSAS